MTGKNLNGMGIGVFQILPDRPSGDPAVVAKHAEELGFASYWVPEHAVIPDGSVIGLPRQSASAGHIYASAGISMVPGF